MDINTFLLPQADYETRLVTQALCSTVFIASYKPHGNISQGNLNLSHLLVSHTRAETRLKFRPFSGFFHFTGDEILACVSGAPKLSYPE